MKRLPEERKQKSGSKRMKLSEPQRREIAARQDWKCANPDGQCILPGLKLKAYDIDHITALGLGGKDTEDNWQALCPACHRRKTDKDRQLMCRPIKTNN